ncbi:hypothetical protein [Roseateles sp. BYS78W]
MLSALLRKLLIDGTPLLALVNRRFKQRVRFGVLLPRGPVALPSGPPEFWMVGDAIWPKVQGTFGPPAQVSLDEFLSMPIVLALGHKLTVRDVIHYGAHVHGAVHAGAPSSEKDRRMLAIEQWIGKVLKESRQPGFDAIATQLRSIGRVVVDSLGVLERSVQDSVLADS